MRVSIILYTLTFFWTFYICNAFTITMLRGIGKQSTMTRWKIWHKKIHKNLEKNGGWRPISYSQLTSGDSQEDDTIPSLDASQLEWIQQRSSDKNRRQQQDEQSYDTEESSPVNINLPKNGISVNDEMIAFQSAEKFVTYILPLGTKGVATLKTVTVNTVSDEPLRYLVPLQPTNLHGNNTKHDENHIDTANNDDSSKNQNKFAMIDMPPFSDDLVERMKAFMGKNASLTHILVTSRNGIHYDEAPAVYVTRKSDMEAWKRAFPSVKIVMYRLDIPRDCKGLVSQSLDGYGPWALDTNDSRDGIFCETGRPLTMMVWNDDVKIRVLEKGETPPDDDENDDEILQDKELYTPQAIKTREEGNDILAVYTPGHTFGSVTYIFPQSKVCCSGCAIPVEDNRPSGFSMGQGMATGVGPRLDFSGYLTTSSGGIQRQVESARHIASVYVDRFDVILPARGPPVTLGDFDPEERSQILHEMLNEYSEIGRIYASLGIV